MTSSIVCILAMFSWTVVSIDEYTCPDGYTEVAGQACTQSSGFGYTDGFRANAENAKDKCDSNPSCTSFYFDKGPMADRYWLCSSSPDGYLTKSPGDWVSCEKPFTTTVTKTSTTITETSTTVTNTTTTTSQTVTETSTTRTSTETTTQTETEPPAEPTAAPAEPPAEPTTAPAAPVDDATEQPVELPDAVPTESPAEVEPIEVAPTESPAAVLPDNGNPTIVLPDSWVSPASPDSGNPTNVLPDSGVLPMEQPEARLPEPEDHHHHIPHGSMPGDLSAADDLALGGLIKEFSSLMKISDKGWQNMVGAIIAFSFLGSFLVWMRQQPDQPEE